MTTYPAAKLLQMVALIGLLLATAAPLRGVTFELLPPTDTINKMIVEVTPGSFDPDSDTSRVTGWLEANLGLQFVGSELVVTELTLEGGPLDFIDDLEFRYFLLPGVPGFSIDGTDLGGTATTITPPSTVTPDTMTPNTGAFNAAEQQLIINQGLFIPSLGPTRDMSDEPFSRPSSGTGTIAIQENGGAANQVTYWATLTLPVDLGGLVAEDPIQVTMAVDGTIQATSEFTLFDADFDLDLDVDGQDFLTWQRGLGTMGTATRADGDANSDTNVDALDLGIWQDQFGMPAAAGAITSVPEPGTVALVLMMGSLLVLPQNRTL